MNDKIIEALNWRYATKAFDTSKKVGDADFATIKEAMRLAPSSYGIQPWTFVWVEDAETKSKLAAAAYGQGQVASADKVLVIAVKTDLKKAISEYVQGMADASGKTPADFADFKGMMDGTADMADINWYKKQAYIALGFAMQTAALLSVDSCPMEGFDASAFDEILGLTAKGLTSVVILPIGHRSSEDAHASDPKFRLDSPVVNVTV
jgi:nitroreductase